MIELEANLICWKSQYDIAALNNWDNQGLGAMENINAILEKSKQIYKKFKDGCGKRHNTFICCGVWYAGESGERHFCRYCQEIKKMHFTILGADE